MPQHELNFSGCPTLEQLRELEHNVKLLKAEKVILELFHPTILFDMLLHVVFGFITQNVPVYFTPTQQELLPTLSSVFEVTDRLVHPESRWFIFFPLNATKYIMCILS